MRAFQVVEQGAKPRFRDVPIPGPRPGEVQVKIAACGLNFADLLMQKGAYQEKPPVPFTLGLELAGTVTAIGPGVSGPAVGTRVAVYAGTGGLAEMGCFPADRCLPIPDAMPFEDAAGFQIAYGTSHVALDHCAALKAGETVVVLGAAGGVGLTAVEIGRAMGARVIAVARGPARLDVAQAAGAHEAIDSEVDDLSGALKALGGVDVVYDALGDPSGSAALRATRPGGRYLVIGFAGGQVPVFKANYLLVKNITVHGLYWGGYLKFAPEVVTGSLSALLSWYDAGKLSPHVSHRFPLEQVEDGLAMLAERRSTGKVVITI